ncbi:MAG: hypothetical protein ABGY71_03795, partial [bacterium]
MRFLLFLYALSGLFSLGYQVIWLRHFVDRFGSSTLTFMLVISCFIGGLGAGALASRRVVAWLRRRLGGLADLSLYGVVEVLVALLALLVFTEALVPVTLLGHFPYSERDGIFEPTLAHHLIKLPLAAGTVFLPCFFMGVTFPLLTSVFRSQDRFPSRLYAWNTAGACASVLLSEWIFLRYAGHDLTLLALVAGNLVLGIYFVVRGKALQNKLGGMDALETSSAAPEGEPGKGAELPRGALLAGAVVSGFLAGGIEADAFRRIHFIQIFNGASMAFVSFWAILAIFLASWTISTWRSATFQKIKRVYLGGLLLFVATVSAWILPLRQWLADFIAGATEFSALDPEGTGTILLGVFVVVGLLVFPVYFCVSLLLPLLCNQAQARGMHLGRLYGLNTVAFLAGMFVFSWTAPQVNMFYAFKLIVFVFGILVAFLFCIDPARPLKRLHISLLGAALVAAAILTPTDFDHSFLPDNNPVKGQRIVAMQGSAGWTVFIAEQPLGNAIFLDTAKMSDTGTEVKRYMKVMAHFPLLSLKDPKRALLICFGV